VRDPARRSKYGPSIGPSIRVDGDQFFLYINKNKDFFRSERGGSLSGITLWAMGQLFPGSAGGGFRGSVLDLVLYSGPVVKIVLLILLFFSILSWAIIFSKLLLIRRADRESREFLRIFWEGKQLSSIFADSKKLRSSPTAEVFRAGYVELNKLSQVQSNPDNPRRVSDPTNLNIELGGVDNISRAMRQASTSVRGATLWRFLREPMSSRCASFPPSPATLSAWLNG
jgi:hypothetical protein